MARKAFSDGDCCLALLWCGRRCCLCGKSAGVGIEVAHLPGKDQSSDIEDAVPLCFDCHAAVGHYNGMHPRGRKYSLEELKTRRDQIYDQETSHLIAPISYCRTQEHYALPEVGFRICSAGDRYPMRAHVTVVLAQRELQYPVPSRHYNGQHTWNLNPGQGSGGHFQVPDSFRLDGERIRAKVAISVTDIYKRNHELLPVGYIHGLHPGDDWYAEPSMEELFIHV